VLFAFPELGRRGGKSQTISVEDMRNWTATGATSSAR
jgi:hypothetical protein